MSAQTIGTAVGTAALGSLGGVVGNLIGAQQDSANRLRDAQRRLEERRRKELSDEAAAREAARLKAEGSGASVGRRTLLGNAGFGSSATAQGLGAGGLFGN